MSGKFKINLGSHKINFGVPPQKTRKRKKRKKKKKSA